MSQLRAKGWLAVRRPSGQGGGGGGSLHQTCVRASERCSQSSFTYRDGQGIWVSTAECQLANHAPRFATNLPGRHQ